MAGSQKVADYAFVAACVILCGFAGLRYFGGAAPELSAREGLVAKGEILPLERTTHRPAVLVAVEPGCKYCELSMPLYRELAEASRKGEFDLIFQASVDDALLQAYLDQHGLSAAHHRRAPLPPGSLGTPTLVVLDKEDRVVASWAGALSSSQRRNLQSAIASQ